jgi:hypothetical protein
MRDRQHFLKRNLISVLIKNLISMLIKNLISMLIKNLINMCSSEICKKKKTQAYMRMGPSVCMEESAQIRLKHKHISDLAVLHGGGV